MKLFINYRRDDTDDFAGRLHDRLISEFGSDNVFKDVDSIRPGQNWKVVLEQAVAGCDVVLALIGKQWVTCVDPKGRRRLTSDEDWVRFELEAANRSGRLVVPVLCKGAGVPRAEDLPESLRWLPEIHVTEIRADPHFKDDVTHLVGDLRRMRERLDEQRRLAPVAPVAPAVAGDPGGGALACPRCKRIGPRTDQFCEACGEPLWTVCPKCNTPVPAGQRFCKSCGADVPRFRQTDAACEAARTKLNALAPALGPAERLQRVEALLHELEPVARLAPPDHAALAEVRRQLQKMACDAARDAARAEYAGNRLGRAAEYFQRLAVWGVATPETTAQIKAIHEYRDRRLKEAAGLAAQGAYKQADAVLTPLYAAFPDDAQVKEARDQCQQVLERAARLSTTGIRDLRAQRRLVELERELSWLQTQRVRVAGLAQLVDDVRKKIAAANALAAEATAELRAGNVRRAELLARRVLADVADHDGALTITRSSGEVAERVAQLEELVRLEQWCAAYDLVRALEDQGVSDPRAAKLGARTKAVIATIDSYALILVFTLGLVAVAGVVGVPWLAGAVPPPRGWGDNFFYLVWAVGSVLLLSVTWWAFDHKSQILWRLATPFRPRGVRPGMVPGPSRPVTEPTSPPPDMAVVVVPAPVVVDANQPVAVAALEPAPPELPAVAVVEAPQVLTASEHLQRVEATAVAVEWLVLGGGHGLARLLLGRMAGPSLGGRPVERSGLVCAAGRPGPSRGPVCRRPGRVAAAVDPGRRGGRAGRRPVRGPALCLGAALGGVVRRGLVPRFPRPVHGGRLPGAPRAGRGRRRRRLRGRSPGRVSRHRRCGPADRARRLIRLLAVAGMANHLGPDWGRGHRLVRARRVCDDGGGNRAPPHPDEQPGDPRRLRPRAGAGYGGGDAASRGVGQHLAAREMAVAHRLGGLFGRRPIGAAVSPVALEVFGRRGCREFDARRARRVGRVARARVLTVHRRVGGRLYVGHAHQREDDGPLRPLAGGPPATADADAVAPAVRAD